MSEEYQQDDLIQFEISGKTKSSIPSFLLKTYQLLENQENTNIISWNRDGQSFIVYNQGELAKKVLPNYFKHGNYASFLRQLNMYSFKKYKNEFGQSEFKHKWFRRGLKSLLGYIKRRNQEDYEKKIDLNLQECSFYELDKFLGDVEVYKNEHNDLKQIFDEIEESQKQISVDFSRILQLNKNLEKEMTKLQSQLKVYELNNNKKFDKLALIISKIVSGMENEDLQYKLNELFTSVLLAEDQPFSPISTQPNRDKLQSNGNSNENQLLNQFMDKNSQRQMVLPFSGASSPFPIDFGNQFYTMMMNKFQQYQLQNLVIDPSIYKYCTTSIPQNPQLALPPIPQNLQCPSIYSPFRQSFQNSFHPSLQNSPYRYHNSGFNTPNHSNQEE